MENTRQPSEGAAFLDGEWVPGFLALMPTPVTYCRMFYRDGKPHDYRYLYVNPAFESQLIGGPVIGRLASEVVPGFRESPRPILGVYGRVAAGGGPEGYELYIDPYRKWVKVDAFSPRPEHFVAVYRTIDDKVTGGRLRSTFEAMAEGFIVYGRDGRIVDHNPAAERILGLTGAQMRATVSADERWHAIREDGSPLSPDDHPSRSTLRTGQPLHDAIMGVRLASGELRWLSVNSGAIGGNGGPPDYVVTTFVDITERKQTQAQFIATLQSMGDGFVALDADWRFIYVNPAAERMLGSSSRDLIGRNHWEVYPATLGLPIEKAYREAAAGKPSTVENFYEPWRRWFACRCFPREGGGISVYFDDITEARATREALERSRDDLRRLVGQMNFTEGQERARIAREIHDDLQQSLAAVRLDIMAIRRTAGAADARVGSLVASAAGNLDLVIESTRRIIGDLRPAVLDELGLSAALESLVERFRALTGLTVELRVRDGGGISATPPAEIAYCLYRIAQEALNNVHKHAEARSVRLHLDLSSAGAIEMRIHDDGKGVRDEDLRKGGSFGVLGMRERLHALGGELTVTRTDSAGTTVRAVVPTRSRQAIGTRG